MGFIINFNYFFVLENGVLNNSFYVVDDGDFGFGMNVFEVIFEIEVLFLVIVFDDVFFILQKWKMIGDSVGFDFIDEIMGVVCFLIELGVFGGCVYFDSDGCLGFNIIIFQGDLYIFGVLDVDVFLGIGMNFFIGLVFNFGYFGSFFGVGLGFFNVCLMMVVVVLNFVFYFVIRNIECMMIDCDGDIVVDMDSIFGNMFDLQYLIYVQLLGVYFFIVGVWMNVLSCVLKENIEIFLIEVVIKVLIVLELVIYNY